MSDLILTEEEIQEVGNLINELHHSRQISDQLHAEFENMILSHSSLLSANENLNGHIEGLMQSLEDREPYYAQEYQKMLVANAELSFENFKLKQFLVRLQSEFFMAGDYNNLDKINTFMEESKCKTQQPYPSLNTAQ